LIEDMGWYSVNFSYAKPLHWGDYSSFGENQPKNIHKDPPQIAFPKHYFCSEEDDLKLSCGYDFKTLTQCYLLKKNCPGTTDNEKLFCSEQGFYNPLNKSYYGFHNVFDFMPIKNEIIRLPINHFCFKSNPKIINATIAPPFFAKQVICNSQKSAYNVTVFGKAYYCDSDSKEILFDETNPLYYSFKCSSPKIICEGIEFDKKQILQPLRVPFPSDKNGDTSTTPKPNQESTNQNFTPKRILYGLIIAIVFVSVVIMVIKFHGREPEEESGTFNKF